MPHRIIDTPEKLALFLTFVSQMKLPVTFQWKQGRDRSLEQNHLQFLWAREVAEQMGDRTISEVRHDWKLRHGVPILRAEDEKFRETYDANLKDLPFERKLAVMEYIPVSSLMTVKQMSAYLDAIQREALQNGIRLTNPEDRE